MNTINHLVYFSVYKNHVLHEFFKIIISIFESFLNDGEDDRPVIESVNSRSDKLSIYVSNLKSDYEELTAVLKTPRKIIISDEIIIKNKNCIRILGDIKRLISVQYNNTHSASSILLYNEFRIYKNLSKLSYEEVSSQITILTKKMNTIEYHTSCVELKIDTLLTNLSNENDLLSSLLSERKQKKESTEYSALPARLKCRTSYYNLIEYANAMINYDRSTDYNTLVNKLNAEINPLNTSMRNRNKKDDRPIIESLDIENENKNISIEEK